LRPPAPTPPAPARSPRFQAEGRNAPDESRHDLVEKRLDVRTEDPHLESRRMAREEPARLPGGDGPRVWIALLTVSVRVTAGQLQRRQEPPLGMDEAFQVGDLVTVEEAPPVVEHYAEAAPGLEHARELGHRAVEVGRVMQHAPRVCVVERGV